MEPAHADTPDPEPATSHTDPCVGHDGPDGHASGRHDDGGASPAAGTRRGSGAVARRIRPRAGRLRGPREQDPLLDGDAAAGAMHGSHALSAFRVAGRAESRHVGPRRSRIPDAEFAHGAHGARDPGTSPVGAQPRRRGRPRRGRFVRHAGPHDPRDRPRGPCAIPRNGQCHCMQHHAWTVRTPLAGHGSAIRPWPSAEPGALPAVLPGPAAVRHWRDSPGLRAELAGQAAPQRRSAAAHDDAAARERAGIAGTRRRRKSAAADAALAGHHSQRFAGRGGEARRPGHSHVEPSPRCRGNQLPETARGIPVRHRTPASHGHAHAGQPDRGSPGICARKRIHACVSPMVGQGPRRMACVESAALEERVSGSVLPGATGPRSPSRDR